jgi:hypothetical protein
MAETVDRASGRSARVRRALRVAGIVALVAAALIGGNAFGLRDSIFGSATPAPRRAAVGFKAISAARTGHKTVLRSQPWWQGVRVLRGEGAQTPPPVTIDRDAIQWRVKWSCERGRLLVNTSTQRTPLADATCPRSGSGEANRTGRVDLRVAAEGPWRLQVEQQVDVPLEEPPLRAMRAPGATQASGAFYRIDRVAKGRATLYRLPDDRHALRFTGFYVSPNVDLEVRLSPLRAPKTTHEFRSAPSALVAPLPVTTGSLNFVLPKGLDPAGYKSVVIWCPPVRSAYAAATLGPPS